MKDSRHQARRARHEARPRIHGQGVKSIVNNTKPPDVWVIQAFPAFLSGLLTTFLPRWHQLNPASTILIKQETSPGSTRSNWVSRRRIPYTDKGSRHIGSESSHILITKTIDHSRQVGAEIGQSGDDDSLAYIPAFVVWGRNEKTKIVPDRNYGARTIEECCSIRNTMLYCLMLARFIRMYIISGIFFSNFSQIVFCEPRMERFTFVQIFNFFKSPTLVHIPAECMKNIVILWPRLALAPRL